MTWRICRHLLPSPEGFSRGQALLLSSLRFLSSRSGRGLDAEYPRHRPACWPWLCPIRDRVQSASAPRPCPGQVPDPVRPHPRPRPVRDCAPAANVRVQSAYAPGSPRLRVNRPSIVWLAARRQGSFAVMPGDFHLDDARFVGSQRAIKDSRGKCRSRWLEITRKLQNRDMDIFQPVQASGHGWFTARTRTRTAHG